MTCAIVDKVTTGVHSCVLLANKQAAIFVDNRAVNRGQQWNWHCRIFVGRASLPTTTIALLDHRSSEQISFQTHLITDNKTFTFNTD
ncbi:hypothetical protein T4B_10456 [Trichinella pseudospiralis]|uniref:Uncharacterized protein n=1 Tax=Trichinella pseudospiralis TaxID=6337 RepID=A0A0V1II36_TRIPS|nr:hypothetical protein T4B_10456 [Trichinella pseudospiralis]